MKSENNNKKNKSRQLFALAGERRHAFILGGLLLAVSSAALFAAPLVVRSIVDRLAALPPDQFAAFITTRVLITLGFALLGGGFLAMASYLNHRAAENLACSLRDRLYNHIQRIAFRDLGKIPTGDLIQRTTSDITTIRRFLGHQMPEAVRAVVMVGLALPVLIWLDPQLTAAAMICLPFLFILSVTFFRRIQRGFEKVEESEAVYTEIVQEDVKGVKVIRACGGQEREERRFRGAAVKYRDDVAVLINDFAAYWSISSLLSMAQMAFLLVAGAVRITGGAGTVGTLTVFISYVGMLIWPIREMGRILTDYGQAAIAARRISEVLALETEADGGRAAKLNGAVEAENLSFAYPGKPEAAVLKELCFALKPGETVALMGPTGCGKSTLAGLMAGLLPGYTGSLRLGGQEASALNPYELRRQAGLVLQEPYLFGRSMKENLTLGTAGELADHHLHELAADAALTKVVAGFEKGWETPVGENGVTLSGGQKQRMALARILLRKPALLILDDSLSAVDTVTDRQIRSRLHSLRDDQPSQTVMIITQRAAAAAEADRIMIMEEGRITGFASHEQLIRENGYYRRINQIQERMIRDEKIPS